MIKKTDQIKKKYKAILSQTTLRDKQSVRTTFKLQNKTLKDMVWLAKYNGVSQKEVIEFAVKHLSENLEEIYPTLLKKGDTLFIKDHDKKPVELIRKTQVINRQSQNILNNLSKELNIPRDHLVEDTINILIIFAESERKEHEKAIKFIEDAYDYLTKTEIKINKILKEEDPVRIRFRKILTFTGNLLTAIYTELSDGTPVDPDDYSQS